MKSGSNKTEYLGRIFTALLILTAFAALTVFLCIRLGDRQRAEELMESGAYLEAAAIYSEMGKEDMAEQCVQLYNEQCYMQAQQLLRTGEHEMAREIFVALGDYRESANFILACDYLRAGELVEQGEYHAASEICQSIEGYPGQAELMEKCREGIYAMAMDYAMDGRYDEACREWSWLGDYLDSQKLLFRAGRMSDWLEGSERFLDRDKLWPSSYYKNVYKTEDAYIVAPEKCSRDCRFFIYYPGGTNEEINIDFVIYYLMNPAPDTVAVFLRRNGLTDMESKNSQALEILEKCAAECGVFVREIMVAGSSMGAYPAMHSPIYSMQELGIKVDCVLSLDAGVDWDTVHTLRDSQCIETAKLGTQFYLFESPWVGMNRSAIIRMVENGMDVTAVGCVFDEHVRITLDAMGMGVLHWALGDRTKPCKLDIYMFNKLST